MKGGWRADRALQRQDGRETNLRYVLHKGAPKCTGVEGQLQLNLESKCDTDKLERKRARRKRARRREIARERERGRERR